MDDVDIDEPHRPRHRVAWTLGALVAVVVAVVVAVDVGASRGAEPLPSPSADRPPGAITAAQETYLVYARWKDEIAFVECMTARGFPREPVVGAEHSRIGRVASFLGVVPVAPTQWLAPAEARNSIPLVDLSRAADLNAATAPVADGGCQAPTPILDLSDPAVIAQSVSSALSDRTFLAYIGEEMWFETHPEEALLFSSHVHLATAGFTPTPGSSTWNAGLDAVLAFIGDTQGWVTGPREGYAGYSQAVGRVRDGSLVIVRVGDITAADLAVIANVDWPTVTCGGVGVVVGTDGYAAPGSAVADLYSALAPEVCGALS